MRRTPLFLDRYPAKMVSHLAKKLISRYVVNPSCLMDPFCGSSAILNEATGKRCSLIGVDINPFAILLSSVKINGFDSGKALPLIDKLISKAKKSKNLYSINWDSKGYWFTPATIKKFEYLRFAAKEMELYSCQEGKAILLAFCLAVRRCSRADQRSPKPFISKHSRASRKGKHFDPYKEIPFILKALINKYGKQTNVQSEFHIMDISTDVIPVAGRKVSHVITSPPYLNAQDYFRNFKLELHLLQGLFPFNILKTKYRMIGTERGELLSGIPLKQLTLNRTLFPGIERISERSKRKADIVHRYLFDMNNAFSKISQIMEKDAIFVIVCGDNLVGGYRVPTADIVNRLLGMNGFILFDKFSDSIRTHRVPPARQGHKGIIKQEIVSAFKKTGIV
jgi:hypothetical protein